MDRKCPTTDQKVAGSNPAERAGKAQVKPYYRQSVDLRVPLVAEARTPTVLGKFALNATVPTHHITDFFDEEGDRTPMNGPPAIRVVFGF